MARGPSMGDTIWRHKRGTCAREATSQEGQSRNGLLTIRISYRLDAVVCELQGQLSGCVQKRGGNAATLKLGSGQHQEREAK